MYNFIIHFFHFTGFFRKKSVSKFPIRPIKDENYGAKFCKAPHKPCFGKPNTDNSWAKYKNENMKNLEKFKNESLEINDLIHLKGGDKDATCGGNASGGFKYEDTAGDFYDVRIHQWNDDETYNGYFEVS